MAEAQGQGWLAGSGRAVTELLGLWEGEPIGAVVATAMPATACSTGPDLAGLGRCWRATSLPVVASGGVSGRSTTCVALARLGVGGRRLAGAIVGKAFVEGRFERGGGGGRVRSVRLIPCLDVTGGRVVKGVRFVDLTDEGDPVELAARYDAEGADELTFLDITASSDGRDTMVSVVARTAEQVFIPLTVGGGVREAEDARRLLRAGADKVAVNTRRRGAPDAGARHRRRVRRPVRRGGHRRPGAGPTGRAGRSTPTAAGRPTGLDAVAWAVECAANGAGEILLTSMDRDGTRDGFDLALTRAVVDAVDIPVVASGGVGTLQHLVDGALDGGADAVLAASIFHRREFTHRRGQGLHGGARGDRPPAEARPLTWKGAFVRYRARVPTSTTKNGGQPARPCRSTTRTSSRSRCSSTGSWCRSRQSDGERRSRAGILIPATAQITPAPDAGPRRWRSGPTCARSRWATPCCSTPRTASRSRCTARST